MGESHWSKTFKSVLIRTGNQENEKLEELLEKVVQEMTLECELLTALFISPVVWIRVETSSYWYSVQILTLFTIRY